MTISNYKPSKNLLGIFPKWNRYGENYVHVHEDCRIVKVTNNAKAVIEDVLAFNGQTLRGAREGAQLLIGKKIYCTPFVINELHKMYAIVTGPIKDPETAYIALHAVQDAQEAANNETDVLLINGKVERVKIKHKQFQKYRANTAYLQFKKEQHTALMHRAYQYCAEHHERYGDELDKK